MEISSAFQIRKFMRVSSEKKFGIEIVGTVEDKEIGVYKTQEERDKVFMDMINLGNLTE